MPEAGMCSLSGTGLLATGEGKNQMDFTDYRVLEKQLRRIAEDLGLRGHPYSRRVPDALPYGQELLAVEVALSLPGGIQQSARALVRRMARSLVYTHYQGERS